MLLLNCVKGILNNLIKKTSLITTYINMSYMYTINKRLHTNIRVLYIVYKNIIFLNKFVENKYIQNNFK